MNNWFKKERKIKLNNRDVVIKPMSLDEAVNFIFLLVPYVILVKRIKKEYMATSDFTFMFKILVSELDRDVFYKAVSILLHVEEEFVKEIEVSKLILYIPVFIKENNLIELFFIFKKLGLFN